MTLESQAQARLLSEGFSGPDVRAIFAIMHAVPYAQEVAMLGTLHHDYWHKAGNLAEKYREQIDAIARTYRDTFKDAAKRKGVVG